MTKKRLERVQVMLNDDELEAIGAWRYENFMPARSAAIRALIRAGMAATASTGPAGHKAPAARIGILDLDPELAPHFPAPRKGKTALVVEDEYLIAHGIKDIVEAAGYEVLGPVGSLDQAFALTEGTRPDAAVLDIQLKGSLITDFALALAREHIPFLFCSAFQAADILPAPLHSVRVVDKLATPDLLPAALDELTA